MSFYNLVAAILVGNVVASTNPLHLAEDGRRGRSHR
jgi:hypothetical protein